MHTGKEQSQTLASERRRPFTVKTEHGNTYIYCSNHADEIATFYCLQCHNPFGENCVGREISAKTVCINCVQADRENNLRTQQRKKHIRRALQFGIATIIITALGINSYILLRYSPSTNITSEQPFSEQRSLLIECRHRLENAAFQAAYFIKQLGHAPADMNELAVLFDQRDLLRDPVTKSDFLIHVDPAQGIRIICPHPETYGLRALFALPGKPAHMEYL